MSCNLMLLGVALWLPPPPIPGVTETSVEEQGDTCFFLAYHGYLFLLAGPCRWAGKELTMMEGSAMNLDSTMSQRCLKIRRYAKVLVSLGAMTFLSWLQNLCAWHKMECG